MSTALMDHGPVTFEIKSSSLSLLTLHLKSVDLDALAVEFKTCYEGAPGFFEEDLLVIDLGQLPEGTTSLDFERLKRVLLDQHLRPIAVTRGSPELTTMALIAGLPLASDWHGAQPARHTAQQTSPTSPKQPINPMHMLGALVIDKPLRSGQQVYARERDLVVLAACNPGAEAIADGHVHVYAPLRGRVIAGARGWNEARVFASDMRPELVSIAGVYRTIEQRLGPKIWGQAAMVRLVTTETGDQLVFKPLT